MSAQRGPEHALIVRTLGSFEVRTPDGDLVLGDAHRRRTALLKFVLSRPGAREAIETVAATLWPNSTAEAARVNARGALHAVRTAFAPFGAQGILALEGGTISLDLRALRVDALDFECAARVLLAQSAPPLDALLALAHAYGGAYLSGDQFEPWSAGRREELAALFRELLARAFEIEPPLAASAGLELERRALAELELEPDDARLALALARRFAATDRRGDACELVQRCIARGADPALEASLAHDVLALERTSARETRELAWQRVESPRFRGRELEIARIGDALDLALDGHGQTVAIFGDAGVGKTRLAGEILAEAQDRGALVFAMPFEREVATLGTALHALDAFLETLEPRTYAPLLAVALRPLLGSLRVVAAWYPGTEAPESLPHPYEANRQRAALVRVLDAIARVEPLVVLFDDAHAADEHGCALIARTIAQTDDSHFLALVTVRPSELERSPLAEILDQTSFDLTRVDLGALDAESALDLARDVASPNVDPDLAAVRGAGNPQSILREARADDDAGLCARVHLAGLDAAARDAAFYIALERRSALPHAWLPRLLDLDDMRATDAVEVALAYRAVVERRAGYVVASEEVRDALLHGRDAEECRLAHGRLGMLAAERLDALAAADHFTQGGAEHRAAALAWTDRAIADARFTAPIVRLEVLRRADSLALGLSDSSLAARIAAARGRAEIVAGSIDAARESLERAYALADDPATRADALLELAFVDASAHRLAEALALCERVRATSTTLRNADVAANAHVVRAQVLGALGDIAGCESALADLESAAVAPAMRVTASNALATAYLNAGRLDEAEARYDRALDLANDCGATFLIGALEANRATLDFRRGRFARARDAYERLAREALLDGHIWAAAVRSRNAAECAIYLGDFKRAEATLVVAERRARRTANPGLIAEMQLVRGTLERERGETAAAAASLECALEFFGGGRMPRRELETLAHLLDVHRRGGVSAATRALVERGLAILATLAEVDEAPYFLATAAAAGAVLRDGALARDLERRALASLAGRAPSNRAIETTGVLAEARLSLGDRTAAAAHLARARGLAADFESVRYTRWFDALESRLRRR
jgi:DNA-binding SARP family transcriptional activator/Tfp pilus assembly protein PilF